MPWIPFSQNNMNVSGGTTRFLATVVIFACTVSGQFTFTGFPTAKKHSRHTVTCSYPGATSYKWGFRGETYNGAVYTFTVDSAKHQGVWECDAVVNGVTKTGKEYLFIYCDGVYVTKATTTNPSIGDPIDLSCKVLSPSGNRVQWMFTSGTNRKAIASVSYSGCEYYHTENDNIKFAPSTTCRTSTSNQFFNLIIKKVSTAHEGYWTCYDFGKSGCYSKPVRIAIAKPPKNPPTLTGFDSPILGTNHSLTCDAWQLDVRPLTYTWYKDGVQISSGNTSTWRMQPVKKEANGRYRCEVVDKVENLRVEAVDTLVVHYVAEWNPAVEQKKINAVFVGRSIQLVLNILAYPLPTVEWFTGEGKNKTRLNFATKSSDTTWILFVPFVQENDYGKYIANVTNAAGSTLFEFLIVPASPPEAPSDLKALKLKDTNALAVSFRVGSDGGAPQTFTIEYNVKGENEIEYIHGIQDPLETKTVTQDITNLRSNTVYQIKVKAVNDIGLSQYSQTIEAKTESASMPVWQIAVIVTGFILLAIIPVAVFFIIRSRRNSTGRCDNQTPVPLETDTNTRSSQKTKFNNEAFEGEEEYAYVNLTPNARDNSAREAEPEYANLPSQVEGKGETTPTYVNTAPRTKDSESEVYEDISSPYNHYEGLDMTRKSVEDQPYESLKITNTKF